MGNEGARALGLEKAQITVEESISGLVNLVSLLLAQRNINRSLKKKKKPELTEW